jgi:hypothetical protein
MTNYEHIKAMSKDEMVNFLFDYENLALDFCNYCKSYSHHTPHCTAEKNDVCDKCKEATMIWLEREVTK